MTEQGGSAGLAKKLSLEGRFPRPPRDGGIFDGGGFLWRPKTVKKSFKIFSNFSAFPKDPPGHSVFQVLENVCPIFGEKRFLTKKRPLAYTISGFFRRWSPNFRPKNIFFSYFTAYGAILIGLFHIWWICGCPDLLTRASH
jgi:hypothetical protein